MELFKLGNVYTTGGVLKVLTAEEVSALVHRHSVGDWGELSPEDAEENDLSVKQGWRILSSYPIGDKKIWVITEADRSATTVLLADEY